MKIGLIGAGNMARALARGWGEPVLCSDSGSGRAQALVDELGGEVGSNPDVAAHADVLVLCHKPAQLDQIAREIRGFARVVASVLGATSIARLQAAYPDSQVFVLMPNTPVEVRRGVTLYAEGRDGGTAPDPAVEGRVLELFGRLGVVVRIPEKLLEAASAISSIGPAYQALLAEAQVDAAVRHGVAAPLASRLVAEVMSGTAALLADRGFDTLAVRREVTSPGGTTARGLAELERSGVRHAFQAAIDAVLRPAPQAAR